MVKNLDVLATAIIKQAVDDWRLLIRHRKRTTVTPSGHPISFTEIRQFFKSDFCCLLIESDPLEILEQLEKELKDARENGVPV